jgi:sugar lactone lactonase YvrE
MDTQSLAQRDGPPGKGMSGETPNTARETSALPGNSRRIAVIQVGGLEKDLQTRGEGGQSRKRPTLLVAKKSNGKSRMKTNRQNRRATRMAILTAVVALIAYQAQAQNLFVADSDTGNILELGPNGTQSTFASGLDAPMALAFDGAGNLFVTCRYGNNVVKITPSGAQSIFASGLNEPIGLAFDSSGDLFVGNWNGGSGYITKITPGGAQSNIVSGLDNPQGLVCDSAGNLYVASGHSQSPGNGSIIKVTPQGTQSTIASGLVNPWGLALDSAGDLFVANCLYSSSGYVTKITSDGTQSTFISPVGGPNELAFSSGGDLFLTSGSTGSRSIIRVTASGVQSTFASGFSNPVGLAFQPELVGVDPGVRTNQFGFTLFGISYPLLVVEACTNLENPSWSPVSTNTLTGGWSYFSDPEWTNYPVRFYRIRLP